LTGMAILGLGLLQPMDAYASRCGTGEFYSEIHASVPQPGPPRPPGPSKTEREAHGTCTGMLVSENFVVKWGPDSEPEANQLAKIVEALEKSWDHELTVMNHAHPWGSDSYLFNVYVGDSGGCAPSGLGHAGYYYTDPQGWPMIVMSQGVFDDPVDYGQTVVAHEFYHAVQHAEQAYTSSEDTWWWAEATAMWVESQVYPESHGYFSFLYGYAFVPHRQLNSYTYPSEGRLEEFHQYGASIWPVYLSEVATDWTVVRDSWTLAGPGDDPIVILAELLGEDIEDEFANFAAHNATWDYEHGPEMVEFLDTISETSWFGSDDHRVIETSGSGTEWSEPPVDTLPERFGYNVIRLNRPGAGALNVAFRGDAEGVDGSAATWRVRVVAEQWGSVDYHTVQVLDVTGEATIELKGTERAVYLVVTVTSPAWNEGETFDYRYQFDVIAAPGQGDDGGGRELTQLDGDEPRKGCGCTVSESPSGVWLLFLVGLVRRLEN
jgi:hypothetical protein